MGQHFQPDECEQGRQPDLKIKEFAEEMRYQEEQRPEAHDGKNVGEEYNVRIAGYGKDCRNGINGKNKVAELDHHQGNK